MAKTCTGGIMHKSYLKFRTPKKRGRKKDFYPRHHYRFSIDPLKVKPVTFAAMDREVIVLGSTLGKPPNTTNVASGEFILLVFLFLFYCLAKPTTKKSAFIFNKT